MQTLCNAGHRTRHSYRRGGSNNPGEVRNWSVLVSKGVVSHGRDSFLLNANRQREFDLDRSRDDCGKNREDFSV